MDFYFAQTENGKFIASMTIREGGKEYGTRVTVGDNRPETVAEAYSVLLDTADDIREALHEQKNESACDTERG